MEPHGFLQQALVYLAAGVIAVPLCKRLGLGSVLGYLVAGMAIGPCGLRLIADPQTVPPLLLGVGLGGGEAERPRGAAAARAWGMTALLFAAGGWRVRPVRRWVAEPRLREVFVGFSLLLVLGTAALMEWVGLSMALGAFLAGVMLADSEYRHELELDIEPFKGLLLGLFFIAVGMSVDVGLFLRAPHLVLGLALGVVLLKAVILFPIAQAFGYCDRADAGLFAVALSQAGEFAFVLFGAAGAVLPSPVAAILNAAVAVSMLTTPFVVMGYERFLMRRLAQPVRAPDAIRETNPVIVAGFGRFGQVVVRVLRGLGIGATVIDHDPGQIDTVRRFGWKAYYGDATRLDLLESAGAASARLLLVAIDHPEAAMQIGKRVRSAFPQLALVVRALNRTHAFEYAEMGVPAVREVFGSALDAAARTLKILGFEESNAERIVQRFKEYDERQIADSSPFRHDMKKLVALTEQGRRDIAELLAEEARSAPQVDQNNTGGVG